MNALQRRLHPDHLPMRTLRLGLLIALTLAGCHADGPRAPIEPPEVDGGASAMPPAPVPADAGLSPDGGPADARSSGGLMFVDYRHLGGGADGVLLLETDPESDRFGDIFERLELGVAVAPHHLYFDHAQQRLYTTALGGPFMYEIQLETGADAMPSMAGAQVIDTGQNQVGEDVFFTADGSRFFMTFLVGHGGERGGSVGVFDARTNELVHDIVAPEGQGEGEPFILYPHGISANEEIGLMMVTSDAHPDGVSGVGNTVTLIDMDTHEPLETYLVGEDASNLTETVEVLMLRGGLPPFALVSTISDASIWVAGYDKGARRFTTFKRKFDGRAMEFGVALEFYIHRAALGEPELYVSFGVPGVVAVFGLDALPELPLRRTIRAEPGAHHMVFFETRSGRDAIVVENNLLNLDGLNHGSLTVHDTQTGERLGIIDLPASDDLMPESIESAHGHGHDFHH